MKRYLGTDLDVAWRASARTYLCRDVWRGCEVLEGLAFEEESPWRLGGLPNSRGRLAWPSPLELPQTYSKRSRLTVLLWPRVQNYSLTKLRLILVEATASRIQQFRGSNQRVGHSRLEGQCPTLAIRRGDAECRRMAKRAEASGSNGVGGLRSDHRLNVVKCLWLP